MFICNRCGHTFQEPKYIKNGGGDIGENWPVCPECLDDDCDEARRCKCCGTVKRDIYMCVYLDVCEECMVSINGRAKDALRAALPPSEYEAFSEYYDLDSKIV